MSARGDERATLAARADAVVEVANEWLRTRLGTICQQAVSVAAIGSYARRELTPVSDIDYCLVFDCGHAGLANVDLPAISRALQDGVTAALSDEPLARRLSVFWTCRQDLSGNACHAGRLPAYDRGLLRHHARHLAGPIIAPESMRCPSWEEVAVAGVAFMLDEIRPQLAAIGMFRPGSGLSTEQVSRLGPVLMSKAALMPVRLLYALLPEAAQQSFVSVDAAVEGCARAYAGESWWPLAQQALKWRLDFPTRGHDLLEAADSLNRLGPALYRRCVEQHLHFALSRGLEGPSRALTDWSRELALG